MTPDTMRLVVKSRLVQLFRQYPRAGLHLSSSCRKVLLSAISIGCLHPPELKATVIRATENDKWSLQAKLAWMDIFASYESAYESGSVAHNVALLQAISTGILESGDIPIGNNVPIRQLPAA